MKNLNTVQNRQLTAETLELSLSGVDSNCYIGISRPVEWEDANVIPAPIETTNAMNQVFRNLIALKKINASDINLVIPRSDWANDTVYIAYTEDLELYTYLTETPIQGTVTANVGSNQIVGANTVFTSNLQVGDFVSLAGDGYLAPKVTKEVVTIANGTSLTVNSAFSATYTSNVLSKVENTYPVYANKFYVRNTQDQVFKCLDNNGGAPSTVMPYISIDGQLPENPYIETADGYKWKWMFTMASGLKEKFFTKEWMPVCPCVNDVNINNANAVDGRLDILKIVSGGQGYIANGNSSSANIISVIGDGTGANLTAQVVNGVITKVNIINGGQGYTRAELVVSDLTKIVGTAEAELIAVIGPQGGHGSDPAIELGAASVMVSVDLYADENGTIPTETDIEKFDYRQVVLLRNPKSNTGTFLSNTNYSTTYVCSISPPPAGVNYTLDETVYQGTSLETSTFRATVVNWDSAANELWLNNIEGSFRNSEPLIGAIQTSAVTAFTLTPPTWKPYTGEMLYVENRAKVVRDNNQTEQIKIVFSF